MSAARVCGAHTWGAPLPCNRPAGHRGNHSRTTMHNGTENVMSWARTWLYRGVAIERSPATGYYLARTSRGLTADTLAGMRELIREHPEMTR